MGEKGSIKNLYKAWRLFLEEQKKKKLEKQKSKKTSKIKVFGVTFFTFLLSPFFFSGKKEYKKSIKQIDLLISEIDKEENLEILGELKKVLEVEKDKVKESDLIDSKKTKKIKLIEKAEKKIETKITMLQPIRKERKDSIEDNVIQPEINVSKQTIRTETTEVYSKLDLNSNLVTTKVIQKKETSLKDPDILEFLNYMKLEINTIEYKLKGDLNIFTLKYLKSRISELNNKRENFKSNYNFSEIKELYKSKDKYNLFETNQMLKWLDEECDLKIQKLESEKNKEKEKKKKLKQKNINVEELKKVREQLEKEIKKQQLQISKLKLVIANTEKKLKKPTLLMNIKNMLTNSIELCVGLISISIFKNKLIGGLFSAFMLNNSIRGIRNVVNEEQIEYAALLNNINNQKDLIFHTRLVYEDAITQIEFLKYDLLSKFSFTELKDVFHKLYEIGEELKKKNKILSDLEIELEEQYDKTREKVKRKVA